MKKATYMGTSIVHSFDYANKKAWLEYKLDEVVYRTVAFANGVVTVTFHTPVVEIDFEDFKVKYDEFSQFLSDIEQYFGSDTQGPVGGGGFRVTKLQNKNIRLRIFDGIEGSDMILSITYRHGPKRVEMESTISEWVGTFGDYLIWRYARGVFIKIVENSLVK